MPSGLGLSGDEQRDATRAIYTVGHGTKTTDELAAILRSVTVTRLIDVRRFPGSRRHPQFDKETLEKALRGYGVAYEWRGEELGGRRAGSKDTPSRHTALRVAGFRSFADYMDTPQFKDAVDRLKRDAEEGPPLAIMCAETLWWRCHRRMISDALAVDGYHVIHLMDRNTRQHHRVHQNLRLEAGKDLVYDLGA